jgi:chemotaxis protein CheC
MEMIREALAETGNIILNGCLATIANVLKCTMRMSLPSIVRGDGDSLFEVDQAALSESFVLFLFIDFNIRNRDIHGFVGLIMDLPSIVALREIAHEFIGVIGKQVAGHVE